SAWVKVHATATDPHGQTRQPVVMKGAGGEWEYALYIYDDFKVGFSVWNCGGSGVSEPSGGNLPKDEWHYVAGSFEPGVGSKAYIDGELVAEGKVNANVPCDGTRPIFIAHREDGQFLNASIDEVRIWDEALSAEKIASFMYVPVEPAGRLTATWGKIKMGD
ncbi:MAG: LamG domain-containing protein, partial [Candidatus Poribacteria bacterium]